jgi:hypothetical protein
VRVRAAVLAQVDPAGRLARARGERRGELALTRGDREDAAAVIGVRVDVEDPRRCERRTDRVYRGPVGAFAGVGCGEEERRGRNGASPRPTRSS